MAKHELLQLQDEVSQEIDKDGEVLAKELFGKQQPDAVKVPDDKMAHYIRAAYLTENRPQLQEWAKQDPENFLRIVKQLGVMYPGGPTTMGKSAI